MNATTAPNFADLWRAKTAAQARIGDSREVAIDVTPQGVYVGYWLPRANRAGRDFDYHSGVLSFADAITRLEALQ